MASLILTSLGSGHTQELGAPQTCHAPLCLCAFVHAVPFAWKAFPSLPAWQSPIHLPRPVVVGTSPPFSIQDSPRRYGMLLIPQLRCCK